MSAATLSPITTPASALLTAPAEGEPDVRGMLMAHLVFRHEFARIASAIAAPGSAERADAIEAHIGFMCRVLHHHHVVEDAEIWPHLLRRAPESLSVTERLEAEHTEIDPLIAAVQDRSRSLEERGDILDRLSNLLNAHLDFEEQRALPLIRAQFTADEFLAVEKIVMTAMRKEVSTLIGVVSDHVSAAEFTEMLNTAPLPLRLLWKFSWSKRWAATRTLVYGG